MQKNSSTTSTTNDNNNNDDENYIWCIFIIVACCNFTYFTTAVSTHKNIIKWFGADLYTEHMKSSQRLKSSKNITDSVFGSSVS